MIKTLFNRGDYYIKDDSLDLKTGRLAWAPSLFIPSKTELRKLTFDGQGNITGLDSVTPTNSFRNANPPLVSPFRLEANEEVLCIKAKKRPVILFSQADPRIADVLPYRRILNRDLRLGNIWFTLPMRSYKDESLKLLVESLYFPSFFPFITNNICPEYDSYVRFDYMQPLHMTLIEPANYVLTDKKMDLLIEAFTSYAKNVEFGDVYPFLKTEFLAELKTKGIVQ